MFRMKTIVFAGLAMALALAACAPAPTAAPVAPAPADTAAPAPTEAPKAGLACSPNCQYSDLVVGFLQKPVYGLLHIIGHGEHRVRRQGTSGGGG